MPPENATRNIVFILFLSPYCLYLRHLKRCTRQKKVHRVLKEQDKTSDIKQQPHFGDHKLSNTQPENGRGMVKKQGTI